MCKNVVNIFLIFWKSLWTRILNIFYRKGDYHRYLAEFATGDDRKEAAEHSLVAYKAASDIANQDLPPTHPIRYIIPIILSF